jgi:predicted transcriptional regulator
VKNRSRVDIISQILRIASVEDAAGGIKRTKIIYKAFLSYAQLKEYLSMLLESGLLEYDQKTAKYKTTEKGRRLLKTYTQMGQAIKLEV